MGMQYGRAPMMMGGMGGGNVGPQIPAGGVGDALGGGLDAIAQLMGDQGSGGQPGYGANTAIPRAPNWLIDPQAATVRAMRMRGMNPASFNPIVRSILRNAEGLVATMLAEGVNSGSLNSWMNDDVGLDKLGSLIDAARQGGKVLGGYGMDTVSKLAKLAQGGEPNMGDAAQSFIAQMLSDPERATGLVSDLMFGGLHPRFQTAAKSPFLNLVDEYASMTERGETQNQTILDFLQKIWGQPVPNTSRQRPSGPSPSQATGTGTAAAGAGARPATGY